MLASEAEIGDVIRINGRCDLCGQHMQLAVVTYVGTQRIKIHAPFDGRRVGDSTHHLKLDEPVELLERAYPTR